MKYIFLLLFTQSIFAANISEYNLSGGIQTVVGFNDLSSGDWVEMTDGTIGSAWVDNKNGRLELPNKVCFLPNGDFEGVIQVRIGYVWILNEAADGMMEYNTDTCAGGRIIKFGVFGGGDGFEGIEFKIENSITTFYLLSEQTATIYTFEDDGFTRNVTPQAVTTIPNCADAGDLAIRPNSMVIACANRPHFVEYSLDTWDFISANDKVTLTNAEVSYFTEDGFYGGGEPAQLQYFTAPNAVPVDPPLVENCTFSGTIDVDEFGEFTAQTVNFTCPTFVASGTLN